METLLNKVGDPNFPYTCDTNTLAVKTSKDLHIGRYANVFCLSQHSLFLSAMEAFI